MATRGSFSISFPDTFAHVCSWHSTLQYPFLFCKSVARHIGYKLASTCCSKVIIEPSCCTPSAALQIAEEDEEPITAAAPKKDMMPYGQTIVNVDNEHSLIVVRASGGSTTLAMGPNSLDAKVAIGAFEIEDLLVGPVCLENSYLARSSLPAKESFHEPSSDIASMQNAPSEDSADENFHDASDELLSTKSQALVLQYAKRTPKSPDYQDVDAEVRVKLKTLSFFGNRPTLGALMAMGDDISAASAAKPPDAPAAAVQQQDADKQTHLQTADSHVEKGALSATLRIGSFLCIRIHTQHLLLWQKRVQNMFIASDADPSVPSAKLSGYSCCPRPLY